jgi:hypothetical protein
MHSMGAYIAAVQVEIVRCPYRARMPVWYPQRRSRTSKQAGANGMVDNWDAWEAALLSLMGRRDLHLGPAARRYQLLLLPSFQPPACLEVEETAGDVALALVVLQDHDALTRASQAVWGKGAEGQRAAAIAKGGCWEDRVALSPELGAAFRYLCGKVDPWELASL